jgi:endoglucanase
MLPGGTGAESADKGEDPGIFFNQLGYEPHDRKIVTMINTTASHCEVLDGKGRLLKSAVVQNLSAHPDYPLSLKSCDLSELQDVGSHTIRLGDYTYHYPLQVQLQPWKNLLASSGKAFYFQRSSVALDASHAGPWARPAGHLDRDLRVIVEGESSKRHDAPGGWYDAGDYGKYVVNAGISLGTLLLQVERFPHAIGDHLNIPESGNGVSDLLDEIRYELNWLLTMQDKDGGVFFKVGANQWSGFVLPHQDQFERLIIGKSTASSLNFAAVCAQASRIYAPLDANFAQHLLVAAETAWQWARMHPFIQAPAYASGGTGIYGDDHFFDEFLWAASQLAQVSDKPGYRSYLQEHLPQSHLRNEQAEAEWWKRTLPMAYLSLSRVRDASILTNVLQNQVKVELVAYARRMVNQAKDEPFQIPYRGNDFIWGSNGGLANIGMILMEAYAREADRRFLESARSILHYFLGHNAHGISFVTGFGFRSPRFPHHRPSGGDNVVEPVPGFLVGGPNIGRQDERDGAIYKYGTGPLSYVDQQPSFASNEVAINWSAPLSYLLAALQAQGFSSDSLPALHSK